MNGIIKSLIRLLIRLFIYFIIILILKLGGLIMEKLLWLDVHVSSIDEKEAFAKTGVESTNDCDDVLVMDAEIRLLTLY